jgi:hypothetical protein
MFRYPSLENTFTLDCPPVGVRLDKPATLKGRVVRFTVRAPRRIRVEAALWIPQLRRPVGQMALPVRLHAGANRVSVRLTKAGMRKLGRARTLSMRVFAFAISPSEDAIEIRRGLQVKRVGG